MSRHRLVRNMNIHEEMQDDALSDGAEDDLSPEDHDKLINGWEQIRAMMGDEAQSGITDDEIKDTLYHYYFDVQQSINWLYEEQQRKQAAKERRDEKPLPLLPGESPQEPFYPYHRIVLPPPSDTQLNDGRPDNPLIRLAQDNPDEYYEYSESSGSDIYPSKLSRITEVSEDEEDSRDWPPAPPTLPSQASRSVSAWSSEMDYGQVIKRRSVGLLDPNMIPPSPPLSALQRLSVAEPPPSASSSSGSRTPIAIPRALPVEFDPQIPRSTEPQDTTPKGSLLFQNSSSHTPDPARSTTSSDRASTARPRSKLSSLASSRASSSSGSYVSDTTKSLSVATYPHLRPGPESVLSDASIARSPSASLSPLQQSFESMSSATSETGISSMSSHVRRAIEMALQLEAVAPENSEVATQKNGTGSKKSESGTSSMSSHVRRAIETALQQEAVEQEVSVPTNQSPLLTAEVKATPPLETQVPFTATPPTPRSATSQSKLRQTALSSLSAKSSASSKGSVRPKEATASAVPSVESEPPTTNPTSGGRQPSKLALLAQSKAQQGKGQQAHWVPKMKKAPQPIPGLTLHNTHTEYLTPIANGPTATTAITTSYQSLSDLGRSSRLSPSYMPTSPVSQTHHQADKQTSPSITKQSKLAMKSRKAHQKVEAESEPELLEPEPDLEMFAPNTIRSRASPSAFASLLVNNPLLSPLEGKDPERGEPNEQERAKGRRDSAGKPKRRKSHRSEASLPPLPMSPLESFAFDIPSPDDVVFQARRGTSLAQRSNSTSSHHPPLSPTSSKTSTIRNSPLKASAAKEREKAQKLAQQKKAAEANARIPSVPSTPKKSGAIKRSGASTPSRGIDPRTLDLAALNLTTREEVVVEEPPPKITIAREKVLEEARRALEGKGDKKAISLVVIGHVDAGKSTLMGRLLYELGRIDEKTRNANERASSKIGKASFSWAWELDGTTEERERGITMDVALQNLTTPHRQITILDAPGHKDFIPNMISGASQADCALLVVDASTGEFEAGFERGGQSREHLLLVRSLGVSQVIVAVNKLDMVSWSRDRYEEICGLLKSFLIQSGFSPSKFKFIPVGAMAGINLSNQDLEEAKDLKVWYKGPTLVDLLDKLEPPTRDVTAPLRFPIANVFKGQQSGIAVSGRICGGFVQVGERLRVLPGDETAVVRSIESESESLQWAASGSNIILYLTAIDPIHVNIGSVLCPSTDVIPLASVFTARIIVFEVQVPITPGASVELFHHSRDVPASISKLIATLDRATGATIKQNPRVLTKSASAEVQITLRSTTISGPTTRAQPIPLELFSVNKEMGRILIRRGGETIAAGIVTGITA